MIYGSFNQTSVPEVVARQFPITEEFGYELMPLHLRAVCDTMQDRDSIYKQARMLTRTLQCSVLAQRTTKGGTESTGNSERLRGVIRGAVALLGAGAVRVDETAHGLVGSSSLHDSLYRGSNHQ